MNRSNLEHLIVALLIQVLTGLFSGEWVLGAIAASFLFLGREHAQREYKIGDPSKLIGYEALDFWRWSRDGLLDLLVPVCGVWGVVALVRDFPTGDLLVQGGAVNMQHFAGLLDVQGSNLIHFWLFLCECSESYFPCAARL